MGNYVYKPSYKNLDIYPYMLEIDSDYQRFVNDKAVNRIVKEWDDRLVKPLKVSQREDGKYYVIDGQHTLSAWKIVHGNVPIPCQVYTGLTRTEEKDLFVKQSGIVTRVTVAEKLRAEYNFDNEEITSMIDGAKLLGFTVAFGTQTTGNNIINAVDSLYKIYIRLGKDNYINVLTVVRNTWNGEQKSLQKSILCGLAFIYDHFSDRITNAKMIDALSRHAPDYFIREAKERTGTLERRIAKVMIDSYNFRKQPSNRLPEI